MTFSDIVESFYPEETEALYPSKEPEHQPKPDPIQQKELIEVNVSELISIYPDGLKGRELSRVLKDIADELNCSYRIFRKAYVSAWTTYQIEKKAKQAKEMFFLDENMKSFIGEITTLAMSDAGCRKKEIDKAKKVLLTILDTDDKKCSP